MSYSDLLFLLPILIRIAAVLIILAVIYDYFMRKWARIIADTVTSAGADSPENAVGTEELEKLRPGIRRAMSLLLRRYSPLRRYVRSTTDLEEAEPAEENGTESADKAKNKTAGKKKKTQKNEKNKSARLTGREKWYILPHKSQDSDDESEKTDVRRSMPASLRGDREYGIKNVIIGAVLLVLFAEIIIHFVPQILDFFTELSEVAKK